MKSNFTIFFRIEILHEYFLNQHCKDFDILPAADTLALFNRAKILCRNTENKFTALIQKNDAGEPLYNTSTAKYFRNDFGNKPFRFYLKLRNPLFFNYTNLNADFNRRRKFYFSNLSQNNASGHRYLSAPPAAYSADRQYVPGDMVKDSGSGKLYEALKKMTGKKNSDLTDPRLWSAKPDQEQYAGDADGIEYSQGKYLFNLPAAVKKAEINIFGFNYDAVSPSYSVPVKEKVTKTFIESATSVPLDFSTLPPGKYEVKINDESRLIYYDPEMDAGTVLGVIEIFNFLPETSEYALLTNDEKIKNINYQILFAARKVLWKYVRKDNRAKTITDSGPAAYQFQLQGESFVSASPIPLSENVLKTLTLEFNSSDFKLSPLPNPSPDRFSKCNQNDYDYLCAEMNLNY